MVRYLMHFQYIGTRYCGVVRSSEPITKCNRKQGVQDVLEKAFDKLRPAEPVRLHVSSRTDAGVHALCNTAHFDLELRRRSTNQPREIPAENITAAINHYVQDEDIRVIKITKVPDNFHSQHRAVGRSYLYRFAAGCHKFDFPIFERARCWAIRESLDTTAMVQASENFLGTHDFSAFRNASPDGDLKSPIKTMDHIEFRRDLGFLDQHCPELDGVEFWEVTFYSKSFLYRQIRRMMGTLVAVGLGRLAPSDIARILQSRNNGTMHGAIMAPPCGLYLKEVVYNENDFVTHKPQSPEPDGDAAAVT
ncbi:tRNA pseudouridine synthase-like 1 [Diadema setosum]|uniref:tRNA pseudouridine synthase-like 1 n=1 Tax=Diadema setosum TaxID=31175 RepID=UPI003B3A5BEF